MSRVAIGALRHRVSLQAATEMTVAGGGADVVWQTVADLWASVATVSGRERTQADGLRGDTLFDVTIRHRPGVDTAHRFIHDGAVLDVRSVMDPDGRRRWLVCRCEMRSL
jgi:SPP1 family predicted phage head-tail adaptor